MDQLSSTALKKFVASNHVAKVLLYYDQKFDGNVFPANLKNKFILICSRFRELSQQNDSGFITHDRYQVEMNQLRLNLLNFIDEFAEGGEPESKVDRLYYEQLIETRSHLKNQR